MRVESVGYPGPGFNFGAQGYDVGLGAWLKFPVPLKCQKTLNHTRHPIRLLSL